MSIQQYIRAVREFSYAIPSFRSATSINVGMVYSAVKNGGTDEQKSEWLPRLAAGNVASAKVFATEMCGRVVDHVIQIYRGSGYLAEYEAERFFGDARIYRIYEGTTQILQLQIVEHMLREWASQS